MHLRVDELIRLLALERHPEGGRFGEVFRSPHRVPVRGDASRPAVTHIYFLLVAGEHSRWHRVAHDEVWHFYEGAPLELTWASADLAQLERRRLGPAARPQSQAPAAVVPAGCWQTARTAGEFTLVGCTVAPGFDFADFALLSDDAAAVARLRERFPDFARYLLSSEARD